MHKYVNVHIKSLKCPINLIIKGVVVHTPTKLVVHIAKCLYNLLCKLEHHRLHTARVNQFFVHSETFGSTCLVAPYFITLARVGGGYST